MNSRRNVIKRSQMEAHLLDRGVHLCIVPSPSRKIIEDVTYSQGERRENDRVLFFFLNSVGSAFRVTSDLLALFENGKPIGFSATEVVPVLVTRSSKNLTIPCL